MFGKDSTKRGIEFQFRAFRANARRQREAFESGLDPQTLNIGASKCENFPVAPSSISFRHYHIPFFSLNELKSDINIHHSNGKVVG